MTALDRFRAEIAGLAFNRADREFDEYRVELRNALTLADIAALAVDIDRLTARYATACRALFEHVNPWANEYVEHNPNAEVIF